MTAKPRGVALIINNKTFNPLLSLETRHGSEKDVEELERLFDDLDFKVQTRQDVKKDQFWKTLKEVATADHIEYDCFVLCLMSHGKKGGRILCSGGGIVKIEEVLDVFTSVNCKTLEGKPKLVFIQACREKIEDALAVADGPEKKRFKVSSDEDPEESPVVTTDWNVNLDERAHKNADFLIAYSTVADHVSYRIDSEGSYFIRALVKVFREKYKDDHLSDMMTEVNKVVSELNLKRKAENKIRFTAKAISEIKSTLSKRLFF